MRIFAGVLGEGASNDSGPLSFDAPSPVSGVVEERNFQRLLLAICSETLHRSDRISRICTVCSLQTKTSKKAVMSQRNRTMPL